MTSIESARGQEVKKVFAFGAPLISKEAEEERETERVAVLPVHEVNDDCVDELSLIVSF